jgi:hypothetical protein
MSFVLWFLPADYCILFRENIHYSFYNSIKLEEIIGIRYVETLSVSRDHWMIEICRD